MAEDFINQQKLRPGKHKAFFHGILSFHPSEKPSNETLTSIASQYLQQLGIVNTQFSIVKHTDRSHTHLHVVANMVDNNGKVIKDNFIGLRGKKVAQQLTLKHNLIQAIKKDLSLTNLENRNDHEVARHKIYMAIEQILPRCKSLEGLVIQLQQQEIHTQFKYKGQTQDIQGVSFKMGKYSFKGSQVDRKFSFAGLQKALAQGINGEIEQAQEQKEKTIETQNPKQVFRKITASNRTFQKPALDTTVGEKVGELLNGANKILGELLKSEPTQESLPYELTQEEYLRKKKKQAHRHKM